MKHILIDVRKSLRVAAGLCALGLFLWSQGCDSLRHEVVAVTGTNIGVEISMNPANQTPQGKLGYQRTEIAIVPTNRSSDGKEQSTGRGALDATDVLMELKYAGIFDAGQASGIYQRLAVGPNAVLQPGAAFMFSRDAKGDLSKEKADAIASALKSVPSAPRVDVLREKQALAAVFQMVKTDQAKVRVLDEAAQQEGYANFVSFVLGTDVSVEQVRRVRSAVEAKDPELKKMLEGSPVSR